MNARADAWATSSGQGRFRANLVGFNTIIIREFSRIIRIWGQTLVPRPSRRRCTSSSSAA
jgi:hypothetical protein